MPETDDARYERVFWLKLIERAQEEAEGKIDISEAAKRHARQWLTSCERRGWRACRQCAQLIRVSELAGVSADQIRKLSMKEYKKYESNL